MVNYTAQTMPYADNATITTALSRCDPIVNITRTIEDLYNLYQNNILNPVANEFSNISIINFNCNISTGKYFEQIITFTRSVSIRIQIALASVYYDYINTNSYSLNGFYIEPEQSFNLSSITLNDTAQSNACSSAEAAQDLLCPQNSTTPICIDMFTNPWIFNCSDNMTTSTPDDNQLFSTTVSTILSPWKIGLVCGLSILVLLFFIILIGHFFRRHFRSKRITFSCENLCNDMKSTQKSVIPHDQAFQRANTILQPKQINHTNIPWIHEITDKKNDIPIKPTGLHNQETFITHVKVHDPIFSKKNTKPTYIPNNHANTIIPKIYQTTIISRPTSGTSVNQLKSITSGLEEEDILNDSDIISLDRSNSISPKKPSTPVSRTNISSVDESLDDEDAWMSILAVANAELDVLNRLENEQNGIRTV